LLLVPPPPLSRAATVVTRLPGFDGALPSRLETGYVGVDDATGAELFYYLVESERSPRADPLVLWHSGGPRCSALSALAFQIGPVRFVERRYDGALPRLVRNPYSLTQVASILFVDSPVGTGFSYARDPRGYDVGDISASLQILTFLRKWFDDHPWYLSNPFYLGGDSYAGKVTPLIAQHVSEGIEEMQYPLNLKALMTYRFFVQGYIVGNPATGDKIDENSRIPFSHSFGIISDQLYEAAVENCKGDYVNPTNKLCSDVVQTINDLKSEVDKEGILDPVCPFASPKPWRDALRRKSLAEEHYPLSGPPDEPPFGCLAYRYYLSYFWANDNTTRAALGIKEGTVKEWIRCKLSGELPYTSDLPSSIEYHLNLTTRGYRALVYR
ncbi:serine carboxypeptidase-like 18, partial [Panicum virgatum]|uniref:serine carboxypeptidase-like 18 n=1 Tax=Panicum virgatum TaxID=38727 RepID=UPI0019D5F051